MSIKVIVTGGAGFIGSNLVKELLKKEYKVTVLDNLLTGNLENLEEFKSNPNFKFIKHDIIEPIDIPCDKIFHLACPASPPAYQAYPIETWETSVLGTRNIIKLAEKYKAKMLYTSTSEIYGDPTVSPQNEEYWGNVNCRGIRSCYDEGKRAAETLCFEYLKKGVWIRTARIFNTYGENMDPNDGRVISNFIVQALLGKDLTVYGNGEQTRSFSYVSDTVNGLLKLIDCDYEGPINIGNPEEFKIIDLAQIIKQIINDKINIINLPPVLDDPTKRKPDISKAKKYINWEPIFKLEQGLIPTIEYFKKKVNEPNFKFIF